MQESEIMVPALEISDPSRFTFRARQVLRSAGPNEVVCCRHRLRSSWRLEHRESHKRPEGVSFPHMAFNLVVSEF
jgi:hypothetical protein